jgi:hypothetical protein
MFPFEILHNETEPTGDYLGRGTHYSVVRTYSFFGIDGKPLKKAKTHDIGIIWDEDHDTRIYCAIKELWENRLSYPVLFVGERKGHLSVIVGNDSWGIMCREDYSHRVDQVAQNAESWVDCWSSSVESLDECCGHIIAHNYTDTDLYLNSIKMLWQLGLKDIKKAPIS